MGECQKASVMPAEIIVRCGEGRDYHCHHEHCCHFEDDQTKIDRDMGKNVKMWKKMSVTDGLPAKRIEKLNNSEKKF